MICCISVIQFGSDNNYIWVLPTWYKRLNIFTWGFCRLFCFVLLSVERAVSDDLQTGSSSKDGCVWLLATHAMALPSGFGVGTCCPINLIARTLPLKRNRVPVKPNSQVFWICLWCSCQWYHEDTVSCALWKCDQLLKDLPGTIRFFANQPHCCTGVALTSVQTIPLWQHACWVSLVFPLASSHGSVKDRVLSLWGDYWVFPVHSVLFNPFRIKRSWRGHVDKVLLFFFFFFHFPSLKQEVFLFCFVFPLSSKVWSICFGTSLSANTNTNLHPVNYFP